MVENRGKYFEYFAFFSHNDNPHVNLDGQGCLHVVGYNLSLRRGVDLSLSRVPRESRPQGGIASLRSQ